MPHPPRKLLDQLRDVIRLKHYSYRTEETYVDWIRRFILFHNKRHPKDTGSTESPSDRTLQILIFGHPIALRHYQKIQHKRTTVRPPNFYTGRSNKTVVI